MISADTVFRNEDTDKFVFDAQLGYRIPGLSPVMFRAGLIESKLGGALDIAWKNWGIFEHPFQVTLEVRDTFKSVTSETIDEQIDGMMYRIYAKTPIFPRGLGWFGDVLASIKLTGGASRLFATKASPDWFIGAALEYEEEDIRTILGLVSSAGR